VSPQNENADQTVHEPNPGHVVAVWQVPAAGIALRIASGSPDSAARSISGVGASIVAAMNAGGCSSRRGDTCSEVAAGGACVQAQIPHMVNRYTASVLMVILFSPVVSVMLPSLRRRG
jgi:hypothetical protein